MIFHYIIWVLVAFIVIGAGAMYRGQEEMLVQRKIDDATALIFISMPIKYLTDYKVI